MAVAMEDEELADHVDADDGGRRARISRRHVVGTLGGTDVVRVIAAAGRAVRISAGRATGSDREKAVARSK